MAIDEGKREELEKLGIPASALDALEAANKKEAKAAEVLHLEHKSKDGAAQEEETEVAEAEAEAKEEETVEAATEDAPEDADDKSATGEAAAPDPVGFTDAQVGVIAEAISSTIAPILEQMNVLAEGIKATNISIASVTQQVEAHSKSLTEETVAATTEVVETPVNVLQALIHENLLKRTALGTPEAKVDGRTTLAKDTPEETVVDVNDGHMLAGMFGQPVAQPTQ